MRKVYFLFFIVFLSLTNAQERKFVLIDQQNERSYIRKDSLSAVKFLDSLTQENYYYTRVIEVKKEENVTQIFFEKGRNFNEAKVQISDSLSKEILTETVFLTKNLDSLRKSINRKAIESGFVFSRVKTRFLGIKNGMPNVELSLNHGKRRTIDGFVLRGYEKVPKRFIKNLEREHKGKIYDEKNLGAINRSLQNHPFFILEKPPQTLFTPDSTQVYLFMQKKKSNTFDGIIGFGNDKSEKLTFNGTLNVNFRNILNSFEEINLYWQRNPDRGQTFDLKTDIPYLFKSNVGLNMNLNIYRQDSTFATVKMHPSFYYHFSSKHRGGIRGIFETSTVIDSLYTQGKDFSKKGIGIWYNFVDPIEIELFQFKTRIRLEGDILSAKYNENSLNSSQQRYFATAETNFNLSGNHWLNLKAESQLLNSTNTLSTNELLRFGGWNSFRGFNEESLIADFYYFLGTEYRYVINDQSFFDAFIQYGGLNNKVLSVKPELYSFGLGFNLILPIGLMSFQISNGSETGNSIVLGNTKIHWGILTRF